jgi:hypothetical protein
LLWLFSGLVGKRFGLAIFWYQIVLLDLMMGNAKREALALIQQLPDNSSLEDIQYHLYIREKVEHGLRDLKSKQTLSQKEVERRMKKWLKG